MDKEEAGAEEDERERMHKKGGSRKTEEGQAGKALYTLTPDRPPLAANTCNYTNHDPRQNALSSN